MDVITNPSTAGARVDGQAFRQAMGAFLTGVTVVTTTDGEGQPVGMTVNSFTSVSLDPPIVLTCIARTAATFAAMEQATHFNVNVLASGQQEASDIFATSAGTGEDKFGQVAWRWSPAGMPWIDGALSRLECRLVDRVEAGDHVIYLGQVETLEMEEDGAAPLAFWRGKYASLGGN